MKDIFRIPRFFILFVLFEAIAFEAVSQQFNTDNYLSMPHGTGTFVITAGQRNTAIISSFSLIPKFEIFVQGNMFRDYRIEDYPQNFTTSLYAKYMYWVNKQNNGGGAIFLGAGRSPGYFKNTVYTELHKNIWAAFPVTFPFFNNVLSWDLMPGVLVDFNAEDTNDVAWGFTWSSRMAIYKIIPQTAIVLEAYGTEGEAYSKPEYKIGLRWEPNDYIVPAITYSSQFYGRYGAGFEFGVMIFTPQYLKKSFIKNNHIDYYE
ncbi:hypothetical protein [Reichenbachiella ulvae]|uniref:MetA-pathway of phenol degradation n=1 Tax=Reichenbachiella ulvae TaxID=2980104 RepID=A0ABT3CRN4_9BACT|nr:hypothetical protein [Reichenbachiella ulvae]MCV9386282.1 hypothetical protein [Reichenbachiella ulvae]